MSKNPTLTISTLKANQQQLEVIEAPIKGNIRVLAPPGSGKTYTIAQRYKYLVDNDIYPQGILVVTFSNTMAQEMRDRIQKVCPSAHADYITTIHAFCNRVLTKWYPDSQYYKYKVPYDWQIKKQLEESIGKLCPGKDKPNAKEVLNYINISKYHNLTAEDSYQWFTEILGKTQGELLYTIRKQFDNWLIRNRSLTFADMLYLAEQELNNNSALKSRLQAKYSHIIVDEGQDTNYQAMRILLSFSNNFLAVGDNDQLLYRFQGARPELLTGELENFLDNITTIKLNVNYRSHDEIINAFQSLIAYNYSDLGGPDDQVFAKNVTGVKGVGGSVDYQFYESPEHEALETANQINNLIHNDGYQPGNIFIGTRTKAQTGYLEGALVRAKIPFINIAGGSFWQSKHVADVIAYIKVSRNGRDKDALSRIYNIPSANHHYTWDDKNGRFQAGDHCPTRYLGREFLDKINYDLDNIDKVLLSRDGWRYKTKDKDYSLYGPTKAQDLQEMIWAIQSTTDQADNVGQIIDMIISDCYEKYLRHEGSDDEGLINAKLDDLETVKDLAKQYTSVDKFLKYVAEMEKVAQDAIDKNWGDYVILSTYHRLKGLERKVIFGLGWSEGYDIETGEMRGLLPHTFSLVPPPQFGVLPSGPKSPVEDERRIAFVCISRASEKVFLSGIESYRSWILKPSRFVNEAGLIKDNDHEK